MREARDKVEAADKSFSELNAGGKLVFLGKVLVFFMTFGFAFPTIFGD